jgi:VIT1/CCC1 family predicted Fe2+/Mn2+ transporter
MATSAHSEHHVIARIGWLRAAVLGANDGLLSTASLIVGVASANPDHAQVLIAGIAGLAAGSMSMAAGEYVSVSSQSDTEEADIAREKTELRQHPQAELNELSNIYVQRGLSSDLAKQVAQQLMAKDALAAHTRDELHLVDMTAARPVQAAITSAISFAAGAALPLLVVLLASAQIIVPGVIVASLVLLGVLGALGAYAGGANIWRGIARVMFWGALAMAITAGIGHIFGTVV